jgi:plasmid rolling circle replication initiator protein Rep
VNHPAQAGAVEAPPAPIQRPFEPFDKRRRWNAPIAAVLMSRTETREAGKAISDCVRRMSAVLELRDDAAVLAYLRGGHFCHQRLCPFCEWRRARAWQARLTRGLEKLAAEFPTARALFLTLTVKNCPVEKLRQTILEMHAGWGRMQRLAKFPTQHWLRRTEITVGSLTQTLTPDRADFNMNLLAPDISAAAAFLPQSSPARLTPIREGAHYIHPHIHALLIVPKAYYSKNYIKQTEWQAMWQMSARLDYAPVVDIRNAYNDKVSRSSRPPITQCVQEAAKYISKASDIIKLGPLAAELHEQIRGIRMIQASQKMSQYVKSEPLQEDELLDTMREANPSSCFEKVIAEWSDALESYVITG